MIINSVCTVNNHIRKLGNWEVWEMWIVELGNENNLLLLFSHFSFAGNNYTG